MAICWDSSYIQRLGVFDAFSTDIKGSDQKLIGGLRQRRGHFGRLLGGLARVGEFGSAVEVVFELFFSEQQHGHVLLLVSFLLSLATAEFLSVLLVGQSRRFDEVAEGEDVVGSFLQLPADGDVLLHNFDHFLADGVDLLLSLFLLLLLAGHLLLQYLVLEVEFFVLVLQACEVPLHSLQLDLHLILLILVLLHSHFELQIALLQRGQLQVLLLDGHQRLLVHIMDLRAAFSAHGAGTFPQTVVDFLHFGEFVLVLDDLLLQFVLLLVTLHQFLEQLGLPLLVIGHLRPLLLVLPLPLPQHPRHRLEELLHDRAVTAPQRHRRQLQTPVADQDLRAGFVPQISPLLVAAQLFLQLPHAGERVGPLQHVFISLLRPGKTLVEGKQPIVALGLQIGSALGRTKRTSECSERSARSLSPTTWRQAASNFFLEAVNVSIQSIFINRNPLSMGNFRNLPPASSQRSIPAAYKLFSIISHHYFMQDLHQSISITALAATVAVLAIAFLVYAKIVKPYRQYQVYRKIVTSAYKTLVSPFSVLGLGNFGRQKNDLLLYNDSHYTVKTKYSNYQVILSSFKRMILVDLIDPELIRQFYERTLEGCYEKSTDMPLMLSLFSILGKGLLFSEGAEWKSKKRIMSGVFNYDFIKSKIRTIASIVEEKINEIEQIPSNASGQAVVIDVNNMFQRIYGNVVIKCFFGDIQLEKLEGTQIFTYINSLFEQNTDRSFSLWAFFLGSYFVKSPLRKIDREVNQKSKKLREYATDIIHKQISKARENMGRGEQLEGGGLIERLVREDRLKEDSSVGTDMQKKDYYTVTDLIDEFVTFFMAGTETTSNMATALIYMLAKHPEVEAKVRNQIESVFQGKTENITFQKLKELSYLQNVQKETLRMYSPTAGIFIRKVIKDHYIGCIPMRTGMLVSLKIKSNHHKAQFYDDPMSFNPERWTRIDANKSDPFSYFPFSSGQRNCIGQHLAMLESKIAVAMVLMRYSKIELQRQDFKMKMRVLYGPEHMLTTFRKKTQ